MVHTQNTEPVITDIANNSDDENKENIDATKVLSGESIVTPPMTDIATEEPTTGVADEGTRKPEHVVAGDESIPEPSVDATADGGTVTSGSKRPIDEAALSTANDAAPSSKTAKVDETVGGNESAVEEADTPAQAPVDASN